MAAKTNDCPTSKPLTPARILIEFGEKIEIADMYT